MGSRRPSIRQHAYPILTVTVYFEVIESIAGSRVGLTEDSILSGKWITASAGEAATPTTSHAPSCNNHQTSPAR